MLLDTSGALLEGVRISSGNSSFGFPPRSLVSNGGVFDDVTSRAEYVLVTDSLDPEKSDLEIADSDLVFRWTKNESTVSRFSYDSYSQRWLPSPGGPPDTLGALSNSSRVFFPIPDSAVVTAPYAIYVGSPVREVTFLIEEVGVPDDFSPPASVPAGTVQIALSDGSLNFGQDDVDELEGATVYGLRQSFFDRSRSVGSFGTLPFGSSVDYFVFLNPKPATGQLPRVRIGYGRYLTGSEVATESLLSSPSSGTFKWSLDTGRVVFSQQDVDDNLGETVYYDGVYVGSAQLTSLQAFPVSPWPSITFTVSGAIGIDDPVRFVVYAELGDERNYWKIVLTSSSPTSAPPPGTAYLNVANGGVYLSATDFSNFAGWSFFYLDSMLSIENGVSIQLYRSGANGSGASQVPDFFVSYFVENQILVDGIGAFPFVMLPTKPVVDDQLEYLIQQGPGSSGTFSGTLVDGTDSDEPGLGYLLNLDGNALSFCRRDVVSVTFSKPSSILKLADPAVSTRGLEVTRNGVTIENGVDFSFDADAGLISFTTPVGQNDLDDRPVSGTASLPNRVTGSLSDFSGADVGRYLYVASGANEGIYLIDGVPQSDFIVVTPDLLVAGELTAEIRDGADVVADRFWKELLPPFKKFTLSRASSPAGPYVTVPNTEFEVFANVGQVNLLEPAQPGESFLVSYVALISDDLGATSSSVNKTEKAAFKTRQELCGTTAGSSTATFNPEGKTVSTDRAMTVYLSGVPLDPGFFTFVSPGTIKLINPVTAGQVLVIDYWTEDAPGGNTSFDLLFSPVDLDSPKVTLGSSDLRLNGDMTDVVSDDSAILVGDRELLVVDGVEYLEEDDVTVVTFTDPAVEDSSGASLYICGPVAGSDYMVSEGASTGSFVVNTNYFHVTGNATSRYPTGTVVRVSGDYYYVTGSQFIEDRARTKVFTSVPARRNYVITSFARTIRPILFPSSSFQTTSDADTSFPFTLVRMGEFQKVLILGSDYSLTDGGQIELEETVGFGESLVAAYVARSVQPAGTVIGANYAHAVAPGSGNGLQGQRLVSSYNLYAPDTFFYRVETVLTFLPEVQDLLQQSAQSGGSSGPNTANATGRTNKDFGLPSPYFDEQHEHNIDVVMARLLKYYNDLVNLYEDFLSNVDGRVVGGRSGRFRFDGAFDNPPRTSYDDITNDVDDRVELYNKLQLTGFFSFQQVPVYGTMAEPNGLSRIFPTSVSRRAAINDSVSAADFGDTIGSLDMTGIRSVSTMSSSPASQFFTANIGDSGYSIPQNGDEDLLVPEFSAGQDVKVYSEDGVEQYIAEVITATSGTVTLDTPATILRGSVLQDTSDGDNSVNHFYVPGRDLVVDPETGQILNSTFSGIGASLQTPVEGDEIIGCRVSFVNSDTSPRRIPALDGLELDDDGYVPSPRLKRVSETALLEDETTAMSFLGNSEVDPDKVTCSQSTIEVDVGDVVRFLTGLNAGLDRTVSTAPSDDLFTVSVAFPFADSAGSDFIVVSAVPYLPDVLDEEVGVISTNVASPIDPPSLLPGISSELISLASLTGSYGETVHLGTSSVTSTELTDLSADFNLLSIDTTCLVLVQGGVNRGLYKVASVDQHVLGVEVDSPYAGFPVTGFGMTYSVVRPYSFLRDHQFGVVSQALRETLSFLTETESWVSSMSSSGKVSRLSEVLIRQVQLEAYASQFPNVLTDDGLYEMRFLWLDQRTNRKTGNLTRKRQAEERREEALVKLVQDQMKLLVSQSL